MFIRSVTFPDNLVSIGDYAFYNAGIVGAIKFPDTLISIGDYAFYQTGKESVKFLYGLLSIGYKAFAETLIKEVYIPFTATFNTYSFPFSKMFVVKDSPGHEYLKYIDMNDPTRWSYGLYEPESPVITTTQDTLCIGTTGSEYSVAITATNTPTSFKILSGSLPNGLDISKNGVISGIPTEAGVSVFSLAAINYEGISESVEFKIGIIDPPSFTDANGNKIDALSSDILKISLSFANIYDESKRLSMYAAIYAPDGKLKYLGMDTNTINANQSGKFSVSLNMPENADRKFSTEGYYAKVFLWVNEVTPIIEPIIFQ